MDLASGRQRRNGDLVGLVADRIVRLLGDRMVRAIGRVAGLARITDGEGVDGVAQGNSTLTTSTFRVAPVGVW